MAAPRPNTDPPHSGPEPVWEGRRNKGDLGGAGDFRTAEVDRTAAMGGVWVGACVGVMVLGGVGAGGFTLRMRSQARRWTERGKGLTS